MKILAVLYTLGCVVMFVSYCANLYKLVSMLPITLDDPNLLMFALRLAGVPIPPLGIALGVI